MLQYLDLFSGIGGFHLAASQAGWTFENTYHSEIDDYANRVYQRHFPKSRLLGGIEGIDGQSLRSRHQGPWLLTGGFPCQDVSCAGQGAGLDGERSGLFFEMLRVIDELRPEIVVCENVRALTYRGLDRVLQSLASIGYDAEWQVISARAFGAPHLRERLWIVAYPQVAADANEDQLVAERQLVFQLPAGGDMVDHLELELEVAGARRWSDWAGEIADRTAHGRSIVCRMDDGLSPWLDADGLVDWGDCWETVMSRGMALGNAVVPQVAAYIFRMIERAGLRPA